MMRLTRWLEICLPALGTVLAMVASAQADVPRQMAFQGKLTGVTGPVNLTIRFYDAATAGNKLFEEAQPNVVLNNGVFSIQIGSKTPGGVPDSALSPAQVWLETQVGTQPPLTPRTQLLMVPYAAKASSAENLTKPATAEKVITIDQNGQVGIGVNPQSFLHVQSQKAWELAQFRLDEGLDPTSQTISVLLNGALYKSNDLPPLAVGASFFKIGGTALSGMAAPTTFNAGSISLEIGSAGPGNRYSADICFRTLADSFPSYIATEKMRITGSGEVGIGTPTPQARLDVTGTIRGYVIQVTGGDIAEPFTVASLPTGSGRSLAGAVVTIDADHPGQLKPATSPYDRKVAGVVSGANGLKAGMVMQADGLPHTDGEQPVALSGRVWCWCDAQYGAIQPGDRLTTSATPGHAMKVQDEFRAAGAVIGKAMTRLDKGKGLVLVLVQPQ